MYLIILYFYDKMYIFEAIINYSNIYVKKRETVSMH